MLRVSERLLSLGDLSTALHLVERWTTWSWLGQTFLLRKIDDQFTRTLVAKAALKMLSEVHDLLAFQGGAFACKLLVTNRLGISRL